MDNKGKVYIIGAGPGDYKLITLKAIECMKKSDVIVYDRLISGKILNFAAQGAELVYVGKMPDRHEVPQHVINEILVKKALDGKTVARVKGGDPFMFGRGGEEIESLHEHDIEFEVIPGVTSAIAVPAYAGIPVTHRDYCSSLHIITGHERVEKETSSIDFECLAKIEGTLVFLMGVKNLRTISQKLVEAGKCGQTPAAVVEKGTTSTQRTVTGNLLDIAEKARNAGVKSPAVIVIGDVVNLREKLDWFPRGKLAGKRIIVTRAREQASKLVNMIEELGGEALEFPTIKICEPESYSQFDAALDKLGSYRWLVFTSVNGVDAFFKRMVQRRIDIRNLAGIKLCAVGEATALELYSRGLQVDYIPQKYTTVDLLEGLLKIVKPGEKVLLARADIASTELSDGLKENGVDFEDLIVYRTLIDDRNRDELLELIGEDKVDFITFTSSSTVKNFVSIIGQENVSKLGKVKIACIGPVTALTAEEYDIKADRVADTYTIDGLIKKLIDN